MAKDNDVISNLSKIILKISILTILFIFIFFIKMFIVIGVSVNILGWEQGIQNGYIAFAAIITAITTYIIVRRQYYSKFINKLLENIFIKKYFIITTILLSFILWFIVFNLSYSNDYQYERKILEGFKADGYGVYIGGLVGTFIRLNVIPFALSLIFSFIGKFGFKQNFKHLLGALVLIFTILNLIFTHI